MLCLHLCLLASSLVSTDGAGSGPRSGYGHPSEDPHKLQVVEVDGQANTHSHWTPSARKRSVELEQFDGDTEKLIHRSALLQKWSTQKNDKDLSVLAKALNINNSIQELDLDGNRIQAQKDEQEAQKHKQDAQEENKEGRQDKVTASKLNVMEAKDGLPQDAKKQPESAEKQPQDVLKTTEVVPPKRMQANQVSQGALKNSTHQVPDGKGLTKNVKEAKNGLPQDAKQQPKKQPEDVIKKGEEHLAKRMQGPSQNRTNQTRHSKGVIKAARGAREDRATVDDIASTQRRNKQNTRMELKRQAEQREERRKQRKKMVAGKDQPSTEVSEDPVQQKRARRANHNKLELQRQAAQRSQDITSSDSSDDSALPAQVKKANKRKHKLEKQAEIRELTLNRNRVLSRRQAENKDSLEKAAELRKAKQLERAHKRAVAQRRHEKIVHEIKNGGSVQVSDEPDFDIDNLVNFSTSWETDSSDDSSVTNPDVSMSVEDIAKTLNLTKSDRELLDDAAETLDDWKDFTQEVAKNITHILHTNATISVRDETLGQLKTVSDETKNRLGSALSSRVPGIGGNSSGSLYTANSTDANGSVAEEVAKVAENRSRGHITREVVVVKTHNGTGGQEHHHANQETQQHPFVTVTEDTTVNSTHNITEIRYITHIDIASPTNVASVYILMFVPLGMSWAIYFHLGRPEHVYQLLLVVSLITTNIGDVLVNQSLAAVMHAPNAITALQTLAMLIIVMIWLGIMDLKSLLTSDLSPLRVWILVSAVWTGYQTVYHVTSMTCSLSERTVFNNLAPVISFPLEWTVMPVDMKPQLGFRSKCGLFLMVVGAILFSLQSPDFTAVGIEVAILLVCTQVAVRMAQRRAIATCRDIQVGVLLAVDAFFLGATASFITAMKQEHIFATLYGWFQQTSVVVMLVLSIFTLTGSHVTMLLLLQSTTATNSMVFHNIANMANIFLGVAFFGDQVLGTPLALMGLILNIGSGVWYSVEVNPPQRILEACPCVRPHMEKLQEKASSSSTGKVKKKSDEAPHEEPVETERESSGQSASSSSTAPSSSFSRHR